MKIIIIIENNVIEPVTSSVKSDNIDISIYNINEQYDINFNEKNCNNPDIIFISFSEITTVDNFIQKLVSVYDKNIINKIIICSPMPIELFEKYNISYMPDFLSANKSIETSH